MIGVVLGDVEGEARDVTTLESSQKESAGTQSGCILEEDLAPGHGSPQKHGYGKKPFRTDALADDVEGQLGDDEADGEESLRQVDVGVFDVDVLSQGVGQSIADIGAVELEEAETKHDAGQDEQVNFEHRFPLLIRGELQAGVVARDVDC